MSTRALNAKPAALLLVSALAAACASVPEQKQELAQTARVTASVSEMRFLPLRLSETNTLTLDGSQSVFEFPEGRSYYAARAIPESPSQRQLTFKTFLSTQYLPKANVLVPYFLFLDDAKQSVALVKTYPLKRNVDFWRGVYFEGEISIPSQASYFVLFTGDSEDPKLFSVSENGRTRLVPHAPAGTVDVRVATCGNNRCN